MSTAGTAANEEGEKGKKRWSETVKGIFRRKTGSVRVGMGVKRRQSGMELGRASLEKKDGLGDAGNEGEGRRPGTAMAAL